MSGWLTVEEAEAQVEAASDKYKDAQTDGDYILQDRFDILDEVGGDWWTNKITDNDMTQLITSSAYNSNGDYIGEVFVGPNLITGPVPGTGDSFNAKVEDAFDYNPAIIYARGGHIPGAGQGYPDVNMTGYCDSLVLAEASKMTGVKWF